MTRITFFRHIKPDGQTLFDGQLELVDFIESDELPSNPEYIWQLFAETRQDGDYCDDGQIRHDLFYHREENV